MAKRLFQNLRMVQMDKDIRDLMFEMDLVILTVKSQDSF